MKPNATAEIDQKVKDFWGAEANEHKDSQLATNPDTNYRAFEIEQIIEFVKDGSTVLDIGCGNGYSTILFAKRFPNVKILGIDYSPPMIEHATSALKKHRELMNRVSFRVGDVLDLSSQKDIVGKFDQVISERCIINLLTWEKQRQAIIEMKKTLKRSGEIILCENTTQGLDRLNGLRQTLGLFPIQVRWHNRYLDEKELLPFAKKTFKVKLIKNIGSLYYIISRVVYAKLAALQGREPEYSHPINEIARQLPPVGDFSPNYIFLLGNK
jgi:ubiquinone/menaquinone biosynthesis C-methylase UbiE